METLPVPVVGPSQVVRGRTCRQLCLQYEVRVCGYLVTVFAGFYSDGDSLPRLLRAVFNRPFNHVVLPAVIVHDAVYASHALPRAVADAMYLELLLRNQYSRGLAYTKYVGLRLFGWWWWAQAPKRAMLNGSKILSVQLV